MKKLLVAVGVASLLFAAHAGAQSRVCGDMDQSGWLNLADLMAQASYILGNETGYNPDDGECDSREGLTVGDQCVLGAYFFSGGPEPTGCPATAGYTFAPTLTDTIFIPRLHYIPERYDSVFMPVLVSFTVETGGLYGALLENGPESNGVFGLSRIDANIGPNGWFAVSFRLGDTARFDIVRASETASLHKTAVMTLKYTRLSAGLGDIVPLVVDRADPLRTAVFRNGDLSIPVISYYDVELPESDTLSISDSLLTFAALECEPSTTSADITFTSSGAPITFSLQMSEPWMRIEPLPMNLTTPATVTVSANAGGVIPGVYTGQIVAVPQGDVIVPVSVINVSFTVYDTPPAGSIPGDLDCDGIVTMGDMTVLIDHLFITLSPLPTCK
jgi:hypothetical protein